MFTIDIGCFEFQWIIAFRGDIFSVEFARLDEVRSLVPPHVIVLALTATATKATRKADVKRLSMKNPEIISIRPYKQGQTRHYQ